MKYYLLKTLGCKANTFDSQLIEAELKRRGWTAFRRGGSGEVGLCVINSCTVTDEADRQTREWAARLSREHPKARIVVTGCGAEVDPERLARSKGITYVIGNRDKPQLVNLILERISAAAPDEPGVLGSCHGYEDMASRHPMDREWPSVADFGFAGEAPGSGDLPRKTRGFLKIQEGCNAFCTYCVIPYGRGPARSLAPDEVIARVRQLEASGYREVVITGTNIGDFGADLAETGGLDSLLERILVETKIERLRIGSLDPTEISPRMLDLLRSEKRFCPHFHVSLQSPEDRILKLMKRRYGIREIRDCLNAIAKVPSPPGGVFVGMDVIVGFPGETRESFNESVEILKDLPWTRLHVFPFSEREGTPATRLPGSVPKEERSARAKTLNDLSLARLRGLADQVLKDCAANAGLIEDVLIEGKRTGRRASGYSRNYFRVSIEDENQELRRNDVVSVLPTAAEVDPRDGELEFIARPAQTGKTGLPRR